MSRATVGLAAALGAALALDVWLRWPTTLEEAARLPPFQAADVELVRIHKGDDEWTLRRAGDAWLLPGPPDTRADAGRVAELLGGLSRGVPLDAQVDRGAFEDYGLAGADPVRVDLFGAGDALISSVVIGFDAGGGATWVRRPGDDAVFRARVGGRGRYDRPRPAWRDRQVVAVADLREIRVTRPEGSYALAAGRPWIVEGDPSFEVDPVLTSEVARVLADLDALDVAPPEALLRLGPPIAEVALVGAASARLRIWPSVVAVDGVDAAFRVAPALTGLLGGPLERWRDHTVWALDPAALTELRLDEVERVILIRQPGGWAVAEPAGVAVDPARVEAVAAFLAAPRVVEWVDVSVSDAGFQGGSRVVVASGADRRTLEVGAAVPGRAVGQEAVYVRDPRRPERIGTWSAVAWANLRAGFGR